jgi:hypothetical protein
MVHSDNRLSTALAVGLFATAAAVCIVLIIAYDRPFTGEISVRPEILLQVAPEDRGSASSLSDCGRA